jgi:hypothetical protein
MKPFWIRKAIKFFFFGLAFVGLMGWVTLSLWNALLPAILGVRTITFWQALGLLVLSRILFGGWGRGGGWSGSRKAEWKRKMTDRWQNLTPEQREQMKARWKKC